MSFSELNYKHQVVIVDLNENGVQDLEVLEVPVSINLRRVPSKHSKLSDVLLALSQLPMKGEHPELAPYLEVLVLQDSPEPGLRHKIENAVMDKQVRLASIKCKYPQSDANKNDGVLMGTDQLKELLPSDVFSKLYESKYNSPVPESIQVLFNQIAEEVA